MSDKFENNELKWLDAIKKYTSINELAYVSSGDIGLVIAARKFYELSNLINCANYSIVQAQKSESLNRKSYFLKYAILDYNACYDYLEQIVYFAFDFFPPIKTEKDYIQVISNGCTKKEIKNEDDKEILEKSVYANDIEKLRETNQDAAVFFTKFNKMRKYRFNKENGISVWANSIKHQGGFCFKEMLNPVAHTEAIKSSEIVFSTKILFPFSPTLDEALGRLINQNKHIIDFSNWLFEYIFGDTSTVVFEPKKKPFTANKHNFHNLDFDVVYVTEQ